MAKDKTHVEGFITRSSTEQAEATREVATRPAGRLPESSEAQALTGHTTEAGYVEDDEGRIVAVHTTTVITDPESPLAVQVPDPDVYPQANATKQDQRRANVEPTPNEVAAGEGEPTVEAESQISDDDDASKA